MLPPERRRIGASGPGQRMSKAAMAPRPAPDPVEAQKAGALDAWGEPRVSRVRFSATEQRADDAVAVPILRDARDAGRRQGPGRRRRDGRAGEGERSLRSRTIPAITPQARPGRCPRRRRCRGSRRRAPRATHPKRRSRPARRGTVTLSRTRSRRRFPAARGGLRAPRARPSGWRGERRSASATRRSATFRPCASTATRSAISMHLPSLWEMKTTARPRPSSRRSTAKSPSTSCGVSTAVGSSRTRMRASR